MEGAHAVYTDVWLSMGESPAKLEKRIELLQMYQVNANLMSWTKRADTIFLHCLPANQAMDHTVAGREILATFGDKYQSLFSGRLGRKYNGEEDETVSSTGGCSRATAAEMLFHPRGEKHAAPTQDIDEDLLRPVPPTNAARPANTKHNEQVHVHHNPDPDTACKENDPRLTAQLKLLNDELSLSTCPTSPRTACCEVANVSDCGVSPIASSDVSSRSTDVGTSTGFSSTNASFASSARFSSLGSFAAAPSGMDEVSSGDVGSATAGGISSVDQPEGEGSIEGSISSKVRFRMSRQRCVVILAGGMVEVRQQHARTRTGLFV